MELVSNVNFIKITYRPNKYDIFRREDILYYGTEDNKLVFFFADNRDFKLDYTTVTSPIFASLDELINFVIDPESIGSLTPFIGGSVLIGKPSTSSSSDFDVAYQSATTIRLSNMPSSLSLADFTVNEIQKIERFNSDGDWVATYTREDSRLTYSNPDITITDETLESTDTFIVYTNVPKAASGSGSGVGGGGYMTYILSNNNSTGQGKTEGNDNATFDISVHSFTPEATLVQEIKHWDASNNYIGTYDNVNYVISNVGDRFTVAGVTFASTDLITMHIEAQERTTNLDSNAQTVEGINNSEWTSIAFSLVDTTNVGPTTNYYPSSDGYAGSPYKDLSLTGKFIDADGIITWYVEATNDEDATPANRDWIKIYGYDDKNDATVNELTLTNATVTYSLSYNNINYRYWRLVVVNNGATNTFIAKARLKAL